MPVLESDFHEGCKCCALDHFGTWREAIIISKKGNENGPTEFYVHYENSDRRWDEWLGVDRLRLPRKSFLRNTKDVEGGASQSKKAKRLRSQTETSCSSGCGEGRPQIDQHEMRTKIKYIETVRYGDHELETWYYSPYPDEFQHDRYLYVCDRCMAYTRTEKGFRMHLGSCKMTAPPGKKIYKDGSLIIYELDGNSTDTTKLFCQCLCLFAKLFLDHKTIYFDVQEYLFYVLCEMDTSGVARPVGYFSKQKNEHGQNLSCILVFPQFLRHGYGKLLIQLSYELSRREGVSAGPEKPLSDLGLQSYRSFWAWLIVEQLNQLMDRQATSVADLSEATGVCPDDLRETLEYLKLVDSSKANIVAVTAKQDLDRLRSTVARQPARLLNTRYLRWKPSTY